MDTSSVPGPVRWAIVSWPDDAARGAVSRFCAQHRISRSVFYKIREQARSQGLAAALEPGSRRPRSSPQRVDQDAVDQALAVRAWLVDQGLDAGPVSVRAKMLQDGLPAPSRATLARLFTAAGVVRPEPRKKPRSAWRRFVYPAPNCCWQIDAMDWTLADGTPCAVFQVIDDHSRMALATLAATGETAEAALRVVAQAVQRWGVPTKVLSDNGPALNPTRRGRTGQLVAWLQSLGCEPITGRPGKPTTQGKNERVHQTLIKWLNARPAAPDLPTLQTLLDQFDQYYNHERPHQALSGKTPWQAWQATPKAPAPQPPAVPPLPLPPDTVGSATRTVRANGCATVLGCQFQLGKHRTGTTVTATWDPLTVRFTDPDGSTLATYPRPPKGTLYAGSANAVTSTNPPTPTSAQAEDRQEQATKTVRANGCVAVAGCDYQVGQARAGTTVHTLWTPTTVEIFDNQGTSIVQHPRPPRGTRYVPLPTTVHEV